MKRAIVAAMCLFAACSFAAPKAEKRDTEIVFVDGSADTSPAFACIRPEAGSDKLLCMDLDRFEREMRELEREKSRGRTTL